MKIMFNFFKYPPTHGDEVVAVELQHELMVIVVLII